MAFNTVCLNVIMQNYPIQKTCYDEPYFEFLFDLLSNHFFKQPELSFEGGVFDIRIKPGGCLHNRFTMAESFERILTMIFANATIAPAAKWQIMIGQMPA